MSKLLPATLLLGGVALLAFAFTLPTPSTTQVAAVSTTSTPSVFFTQEEVQTREGSTIYLKVKLDQPVTRTTKVTIRFNPEAGTTSRDIPGLSSTKVVSFYQGGLTVKTIAIPTSRTAVQADKAFTATITKVDNTVVQGDTARIVVKDQRSTGAVLTGNQNNNTATTTPPTNCEQYAGVLPNELKRVRVQIKQWPRVVYTSSYGALSQDAQKDLALMQGDLGFLLTFGPRGTGNWNRVEIPAGTVVSYPIKTTEYNQPTYYRFDYSHNPETPGATTFMSVSKCPGDFTSPGVMAQTMGYDAYNTGNTVGDQKFRNCFAIGTGVGGSIEVGVGYPGGYICNLEPKETYYLNITAGFAGGGDKGFTTPHIGTFDGTIPGHTFIADFTASHMTLAGMSIAQRDSVEIIKNRGTFYSEARRITQAFYAAGQQMVAACRAAIAAATAANGGVRPPRGGECNALLMPTSPYYFQ